MNTNRTLAVALVAVALVGCGKPPATQGESPATQGESPTLSVAGSPTTRSEQKRAVAGKEASTVGPITAEVVGWEIKERKEVQDSVLWKAEGDCLIVRVRFSTADDTVKRSTASMLLLGCSCKDEFGNDYSTNPYITTVGDEAAKSVTRGTPVTRVILIDKPIPKATRLELDLSATWVRDDKGEKFRFTIPLK